MQQNIIVIVKSIAPQVQQQQHQGTAFCYHKAFLATSWFVVCQSNLMSSLISFFFQFLIIYFFLCAKRKKNYLFPRQLLLEERLSTGQLSQSVGQFVSTLWCAALSRLTGFISVPVEKLSLNDVSLSPLSQKRQPRSRNC